jgi:hypothetical protein
MDPYDTDKDATQLKDLMQLRTTNGSVSELYGEHTKHMAVKYTNRYMATLKEGDLLYIPRRWLHDVESTRSTTVSLAARFNYV